MLSCVPVKFWITSLVRKSASSQEAQHFSRMVRSFIHPNWGCAWRTFLQGDCTSRGSAHERCFTSCQHWNRLGEGRSSLRALGSVCCTGTCCWKYIPWTQEYMQLSRLDIISSLLSEELIVYSTSPQLGKVGPETFAGVLSSPYSNKMKIKPFAQTAALKNYNPK